MRFDSLDGWLGWQETLHPKSIDLGLERVEQVASRLGINKPAANVITVAGTNGKGSTVAMLESIYTAAGYRTGSYTSPHLLRYNERIRVNQNQISNQQLCDLFEQIDRAREDVSLTYFEFGTLAALLHFQQQQLDVCILETGLGGRLDAVNIIDADIAIVTSIDLDHQAWLGDTREAIGMEKYGIARSGKPLIFGEPDVPLSVLTRAHDEGVQVYKVGEQFLFEEQGTQWEWRSGDTLVAALPFPSLRGKHQLLNASSVIMCCELLKSFLPLSRSDLRLGLESVQLPGRFQVWIDNGVTTIADVAHNPQATRSLANNLKQVHRPGRCVAVLGMLSDKDPAQSLAPFLEIIDHWYLCDLDTSRSIGAEGLTQALHDLGVANSCMTGFSSAGQAYSQAEHDAVNHDIILAFGSFYTVADVLKMKQQKNG